MDTYTKDSIGKLLAWRGDHFVYEYGADKVIKFSKFDFFLGFEKAKKVVPQEYALCKQFFGDYLLDTEVAISANHKWVALIQPKLSGHCLMIRDLHNKDIARQFQDVAHRYETMVKAGHPEIDLVGHEGLFSIFKGCLGNILVTDSGKLVIYDATLLNMDRFAPVIRTTVYYLAKIFRPLQRSIINRFLAHAGK